MVHIRRRRPLLKRWVLKCASLNGRLDARGSYLFGSFLLAVLFTISLHPVSSLPGGLVFFLTAWAIPSIIVVLLTLWVVSFFKGRRAKIIIFIVVSTILGLNTKIPAIVAQLGAHFDTTWHVERPIRKEHRDMGFMQYEGRGDALARPILPLLSVGCNEGSMSMYFELTDSPKYFHELRNAADIGGYCVSIEPPEERARRMNYVVYYSEELEKDNRTAKAACSIYDRQGVAARFEQRGLPVSPYSRTSLRDVGFLGNTLNMLLHNNVWAFLAGWIVPSRFDHGAFEEFMNKANF